MTDAKTPDSLRMGDLVGPWQVEGHAGRGSYGAVYRARRAGSPHSKPVALKIAVFPSDPRFNREVGLLSRHRHPGIPELLDQGVWHASADKAHPFFVMEWIRGRSLYEWARVQNPSCREVLWVLAQVARTLEMLHRGECLHRDIKGDNLLVEPKGRAVLTDFGSGIWKGAPPLTEWGVPPNTREYRSPESLRFEWLHYRKHGALYETRPADDIYALGVTAYRLVTGVYPPPGTDPEALKEQLQVELPRRRPVHEFNRRVVPELAALIERMLAREPEARSTAREVAEAAESAVELARPEANVPFLDLEWPEARAQAVPAPVVPVPAGENRPQSDGPGQEGHQAKPAVMAAFGSGLGAAFGAFLVLLLMRPEPPREPQAVRWLATPEEVAPFTPDAGVGEEALQSVQDVEKRVGPWVLSLGRPMPSKPYPDQRRPPCERGETEINGGCWVGVLGEKPPCGEKMFEYQGACYFASFTGPKTPTSGEP